MSTLPASQTLPANCGGWTKTKILSELCNFVQDEIQNMEHSINWHNCAWQLGDYIMNQLFQNLYIRLITVAMDCSHWWSVLNSHLITLPGLRHGEGLLCWEQQQDGSVCWTGWERRWWMRSTGGPALPRRLSRGDESPTRVYIVWAAGEIKISRVFRGKRDILKSSFTWHS